MKPIYLFLLMASFAFASKGQVAQLNRMAVLTLPNDFEPLSPESFPILPAKDDLGTYSRKYANGDYYKIGNNFLQIIAYEKGLPQTYFDDWVNSTKILASNDPKMYNVSDLRIVSKNKVMRLANESGPKWGTLMITVQNPSNTKRIHLNFKYVKADRIKVNELAEKLIQTVQFK